MYLGFGKCRLNSFAVSPSATKVTYTPSSDVRCDTTAKLSRPEHPQRTGEHKSSQVFGCDHGQTTDYASRKALLPSIG